MHSFDFDTVKAERARAMSRYNRIPNAAKLLRLIQLIPALVFLAWTSSRVPFAVRISGEFFAKLGGVIASHLFVFLLCNVIIATLLAKSGRLFAENLGANNADAELYEEVVKNTENRQTPSSEDAAETELSIEEIVYQDKEIISQVNATDLAKQRNLESDLDSDLDLDMNSPKSYRRRKSEKFVRDSAEKGKKELRQWETKKSEKLHAQDDLSNEEFQRKIEEFIAKELKFRRKESLAIVLQSQA